VNKRPSRSTRVLAVVNVESPTPRYATVEEAVRAAAPLLSALVTDYRERKALQAQDSTQIEAADHERVSA
jgi:hypothetical protein